ncbi:nucleotidyltransferase family protein [Paenibacillus medicaginis]|uniref:Nucleotidyltransferase family protein n=1 Tax=Paenibacillus medicaginis TaxID=1470560 RepID=A0ABV5C326_9BACL
MNNLEKIFMSAITYQTSNLDYHNLIGLIEQIDIDDLIHAVQKSKICSQFYEFLSHIRVYNDSYQKSSKIDQCLNKLTSLGFGRIERKKKNQTLERALIEVLEATEQAAVAALVVKGSSIPFLLPNYKVRDQADIDIVVQDLNSLWLLLRELFGKGYVESLEENAWIKLFKGPQPYWGAHFTVKGEIEIDIHTHSMTFGQGQMLTTQLWQRKMSTDLDGHLLFYPTPEDAFLFLVAHGYQEGHFTVKDASDVYNLLLVHNDEFDWDYIASQADKNSLHRGIIRILSLLKSYSDLQIPCEMVICEENFPIIPFDDEDIFVQYEMEFDFARTNNDINYAIDMINKKKQWLDIVHIITCENADADKERLQERLERRHILEGLELGIQVLLFPLRRLSSDTGYFPSKKWWINEFKEIKLADTNTYVIPVGDTTELICTPSGFYTTTRTMFFYEEDLDDLHTVAQSILDKFPK